MYVMIGHSGNLWRSDLFSQGRIPAVSSVPAVGAIAQGEAAKTRHGTRKAEATGKDPLGREANGANGANWDGARRNSGVQWPARVSLSLEEDE